MVNMSKIIEMKEKKKDILFNTNKYVSTSLPEDLC